MVSACIGGDQHGVLRTHELFSNGANSRWVCTLSFDRQMILVTERTYAGSVNGCCQNFSGQCEVDRSCRVTLHDRASPRHHFMRHRGPCQVVFPFDIGPHHTGLVKGFLNEMHIGVTATCCIIEGAHGRATCNEQHRNACAAKIVQAHGSVGSARIDVNQNSLPTPCCNGIAARHVNRCIFMRTQNQLWKCAALLAPMRHLFNQGRMVGAQIAKQIFNA